MYLPHHGHLQEANFSPEPVADRDECGVLMSVPLCAWLCPVFFPDAHSCVSVYVRMHEWKFFSHSNCTAPLFERMAILACFWFLIILWCYPLQEAGIILTNLIQATFETLEQENRKISPLHIRGMSHS